MSKHWIVVDLDGTLCDCSHRVHWAQAKEWDKFHAGIPEDKPYLEMVNFLKLAAENYEILICTGRDEKHRDATVRWLRDHELDGLVTEILMRPDGDFSPDHELKLRLVDNHFSGSREVALKSVMLVLDDRDKVVEAWRDAGFKCWQVQPGSY